MADAELKIILKLLDEASAGIKKAMGDVKSETDKVNQASQNAGKSIRDQFKQAGKELRDFRKTLFVVTAAITLVITSVRSASKYNAEAKKSFDEFEKSASSLSATLGLSLTPALNAITTGIRLIRDVIESAIAGFIKFLSLSASFNPVEFTKSVLALGPKGAFRKALDEANLAANEFLKKTEDIRAKAESGEPIELPKITISKERPKAEGEEETIDTVMYAQKTQLAIEYYTALNMLRNEDYAKQVSTMQSSIELMQTLAETNKSIWSRSMDFINTTYTTLKTGFGSAISSIATGAKTAGEAFKELGNVMIGSLVDFLAQAVISMTIGKALQVAMASTTVAIANSIAAAWAPAAFAASVATLGGAVKAGVIAMGIGAGASIGILGGMSAAMRSVSVLNPANTMHSGGFIFAHNGLAVDEIPIIAQSGEGILSRKGMSALGGISELNRLNAGQTINNNGMNIYIDNANFRDREGVDDVFLTLSRMIEQKRRAKI